MIKKLLLSLFLGFIGLICYLYFYLGLYKDVQIGIEERSPMHLVYLSHVGAYHYIGPKIQEVETWALKNNLRCTQTFGEYLDNPEAVDQDRLRSRGGCILGAPYQGTLPESMRYEERLMGRYVVARFTGSPSIGPFKVYPKIYAYLDSQRLKSTGPNLEVYTINGRTVSTEYLFPISQP